MPKSKRPLNGPIATKNSLGKGRVINPPKPTPLEKIIKETYLEWEKIIEIVRKYNFESHLHPGFSKVNSLIQSKEFDSIPNIVGTLLTTINDRLSQVIGKEKEILEFLCSELFCEQIRILNSSEDGKQCWQKCLPILKDTCDFKGYDFEELSKLLKFEFIKTLAPRNIVDKRIFPYYEWHDSKTSLSELIHDLKDKRWITNVVEFKKLFSPISDVEFRYNAPSENKEKLLVLFSELKNEKLISTKKNKGHFHPLYCYGIDLGKKLFEKEPKRYLESLKNKNGMYTAVLEEVRKLIHGNIKK